MTPKGTWVQIRSVVLRPEERTGNLPEETKKVPLEMWVKGTLLEAAELGSVARIRTVTGREVTGTLCAIEPAYRHDYGAYVPEIRQITEIIQATLREKRS
jgi:hypothetical protein